MTLLPLNPLVRFVIKVLLLIFAWIIVYDLWLHPAGRIDMFVVDATISVSKKILEAMGYVVFTGTERVIGVDGTGGLWVGDSCNGITLFAIFSGFILAFPGPIKNKLWYIPAGVLILELLNIIRICTLAILDTYSRTWTEFNHTYTFNLIIYATIFVLWMAWVNRFSAIYQKKNSEAAH